MSVHVSVHVCVHVCMEEDRVLFVSSLFPPVSCLPDGHMISCPPPHQGNKDGGFVASERVYVGSNAPPPLCGFWFS